MDAVVDTNVVAYVLLGTEQYADEARAFLAARNI
jgi:predicted nucleic acid-binding protein